MTACFILDSLKENKEVQVDFYHINQLPEFLKEEEDISIESTLLVLRGHRAISKFKFDVVKLENWCRENNLNFVIEKREQYVLFVKRPR